MKIIGGVPAVVEVLTTAEMRLTYEALIWAMQLPVTSHCPPQDTLCLFINRVAQLGLPVPSYPDGCASMVELRRLHDGHKPRTPRRERQFHIGPQKTSHGGKRWKYRA